MPPIKPQYKRRPYEHALGLKARKEVSKIIKNHEKRLMEQKRFVSPTGTGLESATLYTFNPLGQISQGSTVSNRVGNAIYVDSLEIECSIELSNTNPNSLDFSVWVFLSDEENNANSTWSTTTNANIQANWPMFLGSTSGGQATNLLIDPCQATLIKRYNGVVDRFNDITTTQLYGGVKKYCFSIPMRGRKMQYLTDNGAFMEGKNLYVAIIADSPGATVGVTTVGTINATYMVKFHE